MDSSSCERGRSLDTPVAQPAAGTTARLVQLDGLRAFAVLAVFLHHAVDAPLLWAGVDLFFVLSGFLITGILIRQRGTPNYFRTFFSRRFYRIFPPYYLLLAVAFLVDTSARADWYWYVFYASNVRDALLGAGTPMLRPMWSLAVEEQFYLVWPVLVFWLGRRGMWRLSLALVVAAPILRAGLTPLCDDFRPVYALLPTRIDLLAAGAALAIARETWPTLFVRFARRGPILSVVAGAAFLALSLHPEFRTSANSLLFNTFGYSLIACVMVGVVAWIVTRTGGTVHRVLSWRPLVYVGSISYGIYLCHEAVLHLVGDELGGPLGALASLAIVLAVASLSWFAMERPLQRYKDRARRYAGTG